MFKKLKDFTLTGKEKAVVAFICATVGSYVVQNGVTLHDVSSWHGVQALAVGLATHLFVWLTSNTTHA